MCILLKRVSSDVYFVQCIDYVACSITMYFSTVCEGM